MWNICRLFCCALAFCVTMGGGSASADVLYLKTGRKAEGSLVSDDGKTVVFVCNGQTLRLPASSVDRVEQAASSADPLKEGREHVAAGRWGKAWRTYRDAAGNVALAAGPRQEAADGADAALDGAALEARKRMSNMDCERDYLKCIEYARQQRLVGDPEAFDSLVWRRMEGCLRVEAAARMIAAGALSDARGHLDAVAKSGDMFAGFHAQMGKLAFLTSDWKAAADHLGQAVRGNPKDATLAGELVLALGELGDSARVVEFWNGCPLHFDRASEFGKNVCQTTGVAFSREAFAAVAAGRLGDGRALFSKSMGLRESNAALYTEAAEFYTRVGDSETAAKMKGRAEAEEEAMRRRLAAMQQSREQRAANVAAMRAAAESQLRERQQEERTIQTISRTAPRSSGGG